MDTNQFFSNKRALLLVSIWLLLILAIAFYFLGIFRFINVIPQSTGEARTYLSISGLTLRYLIIFALINGLLVGLGLKWEKFARIFFKPIDRILSFLGVVGLIAGYTLPCEGLGCIANGIYIMGGAAILGSVLVHAPLFYLILNGVNRKAIGIITLIFVFLMIAIPSLTYSYLAKTLPEKTEAGISQAQKELGITIFKPSYLPDREVDKYFEAVNDIIGEYSISYFYGEGRGNLRITQTVPKGRFEKSLSYGARRIDINGKPAAVKTSEFESNVTWVDSGTEIRVQYRVKGASQVIESEAIKIAESMEPI